MPAIAQTNDLSKQYLSYKRDTDTFRVIGGANYLPGMLVQLTPQDTQVYPDASTVQPTVVGAGLGVLVMGVIADVWPGFNGSIGLPSFLSPSSGPTVRGTLGVEVVTRGYHPAILIDQSGTGAVALTNGLPIVASRATPGYGQGLALATAAAPLTVAACAMLPAAGIGSTIGVGALAQAAQTITLTGVPAVNDTVSVTIQGPYNPANPGVAQTITLTTPPLTVAQAVSVTTAAAAVAAFLNSQASYSSILTATSALGVITSTVNALGSVYSVNNGIAGNPAETFGISISGSAANGLTFSVAATGGTIATAGGATLLGGVGYKGVVPGWVLKS